MSKLSLKDKLITISKRIVEPKIREKVYMFASTFLLMAILFASMIMVFTQGQARLGYISLGFSGYFLVLWILEFILFSKKKDITNWTLEIALVVGVVGVCICCHLFAPRTGIYFFWMIIFPLIFVKAFNIGRGSIYSAIVLVVMVAFAYIPFINNLMMGDYPEFADQVKDTVKLFLIMDYIMVYFVSMVTSLVSITLINRLSNLKDVYYQEANTDVTTGLRNQAYFLSYVNKLPSLVEEGDSIGLMFIDIDDFKLFNDKFGHTVGNEILVTVANKINEIPHALCVRWGGDEFAIVERNLTRDEFIAKANYLLKSVEGLGKNITISIGLAYYTVDDNFDFDKIFNEADMQAIRAKGKGKNCVIIKE